MKIQDKVLNKPDRRSADLGLPLHVERHFPFGVRVVRIEIGQSERDDIEVQQLVEGQWIFRRSFSSAVRGSANALNEAINEAEELWKKLAGPGELEYRSWDHSLR